MKKEDFELFKKMLKDKNIFMEIDDASCGCCGHSDMNITIDGLTFFFHHSDMTFNTNEETKNEN